MKKRGHGGFTLVELIVSMGIAITIIALTCTVLLSSLKFYDRDSNLTQAKNIGDLILEHMEDNLRYATALTLATKEEALTADANPYAMAVEEGRLYEWTTDKPTEKKDYYGEDFYPGMTISTDSYVTESKTKKVTLKKTEDGTEVEIEVPQNQWLTIRLEVKDREGELLYHTEKTFELLNLSANIESAELGTSFANKNLRILGTTAVGEEHAVKNAIFCYDAKKVNNRADYNAAPTKMFDEVMEFVGMPMDEKQRLYKELVWPTQPESERKNYYDNNDLIRNYIRIVHYKGEWPKLSDYVDVSKYGVEYNKKNELKEIAEAEGNSKLKLTFYYEPKTKSCVIYANNTPGQQWKMQCIYVPDNPSLTTLSLGHWYTFYPTLDTVMDESDKDYSLKKLIKGYENFFSLTNTPHFEEGKKLPIDGTTYSLETLDQFYNMFRTYWNPMITTN